jgi:hypothetical protein
MRFFIRNSKQMCASHIIKEHMSLLQTEFEEFFQLNLWEISVQ